MLAGDVRALPHAPGRLSPRRTPRAANRISHRQNTARSRGIQVQNSAYSRASARLTVASFRDRQPAQQVLPCLAFSAIYHVWRPQNSGFREVQGVLWTRATLGEEVRARLVVAQCDSLDVT